MQEQCYNVGRLFLPRSRTSPQSQAGPTDRELYEQTGTQHPADSPPWL